jgi:hypothetical protein
VTLTPNLTANSTADEHRRGPQHADLIPGINALFVITPEEVHRLQTTHQAIFFFRNKLEQATCSLPSSGFPIHQRQMLSSISQVQIISGTLISIFAYHTGLPKSLVEKNLVSSKAWKKH